MFPAMARGCWTGVEGVIGVTGVSPPRISSRPFLSAVSSTLGRADLKNDTCNKIITITFFFVFFLLLLF